MIKINNELLGNLPCKDFLDKQLVLHEQRRSRIAVDFRSIIQQIYDVVFKTILLSEIKK